MMALYAFDGTWNTDKTKDSTNKNSNVVRFKNAYSKNTGKDEYYVTGVGTRMKWVGRIIGGAFGAGELPRLNEAYQRLCENWEDQDQVIDIIGFSRGAATALDFCHLLQDRGIRKPSDGAVVVETNPRIRFLGLWDVVPAFGLGFFGNQVLNFGHHLTLPTNDIDYCFHALALDEKRPSFIPTRLGGAYEVWFRGVHSDIGGGNSNLKLNDISLKWMMSKAKAAGVPIKDGDISVLRPDATAPISSNPKILEIRNIARADRWHYSVDDRDGCRSIVPGSPVESPNDEKLARKANAGIEVLSEVSRKHVEQLWEAAVTRAIDHHHVSLDSVEDAFLGLILGRVAIVSDQHLDEAIKGTMAMVDGMMAIARETGFGQPAPVFLNLALNKYRHVFPYTA